ncbi:MAG: hypothetical protein OXU64_09605 [Gemmatimonadota bacterium]|nr:hypothetical protein [Gemmatimonadota bacterium]
MNIVKASLQNAVRRMWKFALALFLCGAGLAVLTNVYDAAATVERMGAAGEVTESGDAPPTEEGMEAMARAALMLFFVGVLNLFFGFGTVLFAFLAPGGMVANERGSAAIMLWAQHPMRLSTFYMRRYAGVQIATLGAMLVFGLTAAVAALPPEASPATAVGGVASTCLVGMIACAVSFAISALGVRRAALFGLVYYLPSPPLARLLELSEVSPSTVAELARTILPFAIFPLNAIEGLAGGLESGAAWDWGGTGMILYHFALWTGVAWLGLRRIDGRPLKL